jgi:hypothetical protein
MKGRVFHKWAAIVGIVLAAGCQPTPSNLRYDQVTIQVLGSAHWTEIKINVNGTGRVADTTPGGVPVPKSFALTDQAMADLRLRLDPYLRKSSQFSEETLQQLAVHPCNGEGARASDLARYRIDWIGKSAHRIYWLNANCHPNRDQDQIADIDSLIDTFPAPQPAQFPRGPENQT